MSQSDKLLVVPIHVDGLHVAKGRSARSAMADFTQLPYIKKDQAGTAYEVNGDHPHISRKINAAEFETNFWLREGVHLHWSLPDGLTIGTEPDNPNRRSQPEFPAVPNRWLVQRCYYEGIVQKQWLVESDFLYDPEYWDETPEDSTRSELKRYLVAYPLPIEATGQPPFRYLGRQTEFNSGTTNLANGTYLASYLHSLKQKGIDISDYPDKLTAIGYGEPSFAAFYPNSHSVFGLYDDDFGSTPPPVGSWYEVYGWYEHAEGANSLMEDPIYQLTQAIPDSVDSNNFPAWFEATQHAIDQLENFYKWRATFELSNSVVEGVNSLLTHVLDQKNLTLSLKKLPEEPIRGRESLQDYLTNSAQGGLDLRQSKIPLSHDANTDNPHVVCLETLIASCAFQVPQRLICYGQVWEDSFVSNITPTQSQIFVSNTGTESVAAFVASKLAVKQYPRQPGQADTPDVLDTYTSVQLKEKARLERFIEAIHLTPALNKQYVDIGTRLTEERHSKTFLAHSGSKLWQVKTAALENSEHQEKPALEDTILDKPILPSNLAIQLNELNALQTRYDRALHNLEALYRQIYADWYRYMMLAYPSDDEALDYEDIRLSPDVDRMIAYIKEQDIKPLQQAISDTGAIQKYNNNSQSSPPPANPDNKNNGKASASYWSCDWALEVSGSAQSLAHQLQVAITQFCAALNSHNQAQPIPNSKNQWSLDHTVGPRFWSPNEPTVLLSDLQPSDRYGQDGRLRSDKSVICPVVSGVAFPPENLRASQTDNESLMADLATVQSQLRQEIEPFLGPYYRRNKSGQAHPFMLEWEANLASVRPAAYRQNPNLPYQADEIKDHWYLAETDVELTDEQAQANVPERTISFTGTSVLLNYAGGGNGSSPRSLFTK